jgi:hypothetical protein
VVLDDDGVEDEDARLVRYEVGPVLGARIVERRGDDLVVLGAVGIGADVEKAIALFDVIFAVGEARGNDMRLAALDRVDQVDFRSLMMNLSFCVLPTPTKKPGSLSS